MIAFLDTDYISLLCRTKDNQGNVMLDLMLNYPDMTFFCHSQIIKELFASNNQEIIDWIETEIDIAGIKVVTDMELLDSLRGELGDMCFRQYLYYLRNACRQSAPTFYQSSYGKLDEMIEHGNECSLDEFISCLKQCDDSIPKDKDLGEIKTILAASVYNFLDISPILFFCSDDKKARNLFISQFNDINVHCIATLSSFYLLKEKFKIPEMHAKEYFDSWLTLHPGQFECKIQEHTNATKLVALSCHEIFQMLYADHLQMQSNGMLAKK